MTLPTSGEITLDDLNIEMGNSSGSPISLNDTDVRKMANLSSGSISLSDLYGKSWVTQGDVVSWMQTNRNTNFKWVFGGTGDTRYVNNPYSRYTSSSSYTFSYSSSGLPSTYWTTLVVTVSGFGAGGASFSINYGAITPTSTTVSYSGTDETQYVLQFEESYDTITTVGVTWTHGNGNAGSWASCVMLPGKWSGTYSSASTSLALPSNAVSVGGCATVGSNPAFISSPPAGASRMAFGADWYNASLFGVLLNPTGGQVTQNFTGSGFKQTLFTTMSDW